MEPETTRTPCFIAEEECLVTPGGGDVEAGISGNNENHQHHHPFTPTRSNIFGNNMRNNSRFSLSRSARFYDARCEDNNPHFLESCFLCQKPLGNNRDIFMYRGDTPFCSEECREEQIERDESKEKKWNLSSSMKALRKKEQRESSSPTKTEEHPLRTSTIAAA